MYCHDISTYSKNESSATTISEPDVSRFPISHSFRRTPWLVDMEYFVKCKILTSVRHGTGKSYIRSRRKDFLMAAFWLFPFSFPCSKFLAEMATITCRHTNVLEINRTDFSVLPRIKNQSFSDDFSWPPPGQQWPAIFQFYQEC